MLKTPDFLTPKLLYNVFAATTRAHYQSHELRLLDAAVGVYYGLACIALGYQAEEEEEDEEHEEEGRESNEHQALRMRKVAKEVLGKLCSMLGHKYAKVRYFLFTAYLGELGERMGVEDEGNGGWVGGRGARAGKGWVGGRGKGGTRGGRRSAQTE